MDIEFIFCLNAVFGAVFCGLYIWVKYSPNNRTKLIPKKIISNKQAKCGLYYRWCEVCKFNKNGCTANIVDGRIKIINQR